MQLISKTVLTVISMLIFLSNSIETKAQVFAPHLSATQVSNKIRDPKVKVFYFKAKEKSVENRLLTSAAINKIKFALGLGMEVYQPGVEGIQMFKCNPSSGDQVLFVRTMYGSNIRILFTINEKNIVTVDKCQVDDGW